MTLQVYPEHRAIIGEITSCVFHREDSKELPTISGYASVFYDDEDTGTEYELFEGVRERIDPNAFDETLKRQDDVVALFNHDNNMILGRKSAGNLTLEVDKTGLRYNVQPVDTSVGRDMMTLVEQRQVVGSSFGFYVEKATWEERDGFDVRNIEQVTLVDVSPVTTPAYKSTTAIARSQSTVNPAFREWQGWREHRTGERKNKFIDYRRRAALAALDC